jgi:transcriptional regulator with PAS, ATPase and Fis domain
MDMSNEIDTKNGLIQKMRDSLGGYELTPLIAEAMSFTLRNSYEGFILIDTHGLIAFMDRPTERLFGLDPGDAKGLPLADFFPNSGLTDVCRNGIPQIGEVQEVKGEKKIVSRYPIFRNGQLAGALGKVVFHELKEIRSLSTKIERLEAKISSYKRTFLARNKANYTFNDIIGTSNSIKETIKRARQVALTDCTVLINGESGTGKELFAHSIHQTSSRSKGPLIKVNCAAVPFELAESELFGYGKGAFTGASKSGQKGKFEQASGGTIFLDEISSMPLAIQAKLLRIIQEKEMQQIGSSETKKVDFRLIAAANVDLLEQVHKGSFRADLYYRLSSVPVSLSPLRERREDIPFLVKALLPGVCRKLNGSAKSISQRALNIMRVYDWPGNVRELINVLEQSILSAELKSEIDEKDLPIFLHKIDPVPYVPSETLSHIVAEAEKNAIHQALLMTKGNKRRCAQLLGISRAALYGKLHRYKMIPN